MTLKLPLVALSTIFVTAPLLAASFGGVDVPPPPSPRPVTETHFGQEVSDPYRFFEDVKDPAVQAWMKAQAGATEAILAKIPGRDDMLARIREVESKASGVTDAAVRTANGRYFFLKRDPGDNQFRLVWREGADGADRLIVDPEALAKKTGTPHAVMDFRPSRDGRKLAYAIQAGGGEIGVLHVVDVESGRELIPPIDRIRYAGVAWLDDGTGFFYSRLREGYEKLPPGEKFADRARHFHALDAANTDRVVFSPRRDAALELPDYAGGYVMQIPGTKIAAMLVSLGVERYGLLYFADLDAAKAGTARWRPVATIDDKVVNHAVGGDYLYVRTSKSNPRYEVLRVPIAAPDLAKAEVAMPASEGVIVDIRGARDALYIVRRDGATQSLWRLTHNRNAKPTKVALPFEGAVEITGASAHVDGVVLELASWTRAVKPYRYEPKSRALAQLPFVAPGAYDAPQDIVAREVRYASHDGVQVPLSIVARSDVKLDGTNPTIVYGYGAYGATEDPFFNPRIYAWIQRGGVFAFAHVRGGGAFGEEWHLAGRKATKPNTWKDTIAAAEWLVANKYTSPKQIGVYGGSAGGILVGRAITERPDLFAAAVPVVGVLDAPRMEASANGAANIPEFGTMKNESEARALLAMSTYHAIRDGTPYPGILFVHGVNDIRVDVWQTLKAAARFQQATTSGRPVLMRLEYDSGHGQGSTRAQSQARAADIWSFMLWQFGDPQFQPSTQPAAGSGTPAAPESTPRAS